MAPSPSTIGRPRSISWADVNRVLADRRTETGRRDCATLVHPQHGRPATSDRHVLFRCVAPRQPISAAGVSSCARLYLLKASIDVRRPGSPTSRHMAVQRLLDANFARTTTGVFLRQRSARSTEIYAHVAVEALREVAMGDGGLG